MSLLDTASLIVTPNGYKEGKLYSVIPSDGSGDLSVTRATTATRVNSAGLVELVPYNQFNYSQKFDNAYWIKSSSNVTAENTTAPDGTTTADKMTITAGFGAVYASSIPLEGTHTISCFFKKGDATSVYIDTNGTSGNIFGSLNLDTLATSSVGGAIVNVENAGNGWYRLSITASFTGTTSYIAFGILSASSNLFTYLWGAQLVEGSTAKDYQKTETRLNIPRLDYSNGTCPSLLVEPQRTNLTLYSSSFDNAAWTKSNTTATANTIISPSGIQDADSVAETTATNSHELSSNAITFLASTKYTATLYAKWDAACTRNIHIRFGNCPSVNIGASFDKNGNFVNYTGGSNGTLDSYSATDVGNGWWKFVITITTAAVSSSGQGLYVYYMDGTTLFYTGNTSQVINFWGAQLEAGSYATSYIPTTSASVTRNADVISKTGISSLIGQTEGTLFVDAYIDIQNEELSPVVGLFALNNNASNLNNCIVIGIDRPASGTSNQIYGFVINGGTDQAILNSSNITAGRHKIAFAYKANDFVLYVNGVLIGSDTSGSVPTLSQALIGSRYNGDTYFLGDEVNAAALWKQRLTNTQLAQLTTI